MSFRLHSSCENFVGQTIFDYPVHGWGWSRWDGPDEDTASYSIEAPSPFWLRVEHLTKHRENLNGFMGHVEMPQHPFHGLWVVTCLRYGGEYDLISSTATSDVLLGVNKPYLGSLSDDPEMEQYFRKKGTEPWYPLWRFKGTSQIVGYAELAASQEVWKEHSQISGRNNDLPL